jgi:hypothetical protein
VVKNCIDPTFLGTAIYATVEFKTRKLSRLKECRILNNGDVEFDTLNTTYCAEFSREVTREYFIKTCETIGRLKCEPLPK